jgi:hypothetical protein
MEVSLKNKVIVSQGVAVPALSLSNPGIPAVEAKLFGQSIPYTQLTSIYL